MSDVQSPSTATDAPRLFGDLLVELGLVTGGQVQEALALQPLTGHRVGEALLSLGYLTRAQLQRALALAIQRGERVVLERPPLGEILVGLRYLTTERLTQALEQQRLDGRRLGEVVVGLGFCEHPHVYEALGLQQRMSQGTEARPAEKTEALRPSNVRRVMVVDDSELSCAVVEQGLLEAGYEVVTFTDPFLALEQVDLIHPDVVLTDLDMPGITGAELCRRLKEAPNRATLPVLILTANDAETQKVGGLRAGADDYVNKGASMDELSARIESILRRTSETERVRKTFARYTSDAVVEQILNSGGVVLTGERREVTVLFADIRNFTSLAESMEPEEVMRQLNGVLASLADAVLEWGGTLDKFLGDGLMAVWGAPVHKEDDTEAAVSAAVQMCRAVQLRNESRTDLPPLGLGVGLNTGPVIAGSLGSVRRSEYTCIGDTVNVASRLCGIAGAGEVILGEATALKLRYLSPAEPLEKVKVKGKAQPLPVYRVTPALDEALKRRTRF